MQQEMLKYLNEDSKRGWIDWFAEHHWVAEVPVAAKIPATIINRSAVAYGCPLLAIRSQAPQNLSEILIDRLRTGRPMYATCLGEPPTGIHPLDIVRQVSMKGIWIDPTLDLRASAVTLTKLAHAIVLKNGLVDFTRGIYNRLVTGMYPGTHWLGPKINLGGLAA